MNTEELFMKEEILKTKGKVGYIEYLESIVEKLRGDIGILEDEIDDLQTENAFLLLELDKCQDDGK